MKFFNYILIMFLISPILQIGDSSKNSEIDELYTFLILMI